MNQHDQILALLDSDLAFCHDPMGQEALNQLCAAIKQALAAEPAPLVRLTEGEIDKLDCVEIGYGFYGDYWISSKSVKDFANAIMDAMERVNK